MTKAHDQVEASQQLNNYYDRHRASGKREEKTEDFLAELRLPSIQENGIGSNSQSRALKVLDKTRAQQVEMEKRSQQYQQQ